MRSIVLMGAVAAFLVCLTGPASAQKPGGVLKMYHRDNPPSASIHEEATNSTVIPFMAVMNNLVIFDQGKPQNSPDDIVPDLAKSWSWSADGRDLTFILQEGVKWHDGKPFTAKDVVCTFDMLMNKGDNRLRKNPRTSWYGNVDHVTADSDLQATVQHEPRDFAAFETLSKIAEAREDWKNAYAAWQKVMEIDPKTPGGEDRLNELKRKALGEET